MASLKDVERVTDDLENLVGDLKKELKNGDFDRLIQLADQISEHADEAAGTFATVNEALMGRINELSGRNSNQKSGSRS
jgi:ABC-type transporter Mla subunit MlaD